MFCGISVVRMLSSPFFSIFLFHVQMTAIKAGQTRAKQRAPLNAISSRRERNKGWSDSSGREGDKPIILMLSTSKRCLEQTHCPIMGGFIFGYVNAHTQTHTHAVRVNIKELCQREISKTWIHSHNTALEQH